MSANAYVYVDRQKYIYRTHLIKDVWSKRRKWKMIMGQVEPCLMM